MPHTNTRHNAANRHTASQRDIVLNWMRRHRDWILTAHDDLAGAWTATKECGFPISLTQFACLRRTAKISYPRGNLAHCRTRAPIGGMRYSNQAAV